MRTIVTVFILGICVSTSAQNELPELKRLIDAIQKMYSVHFIYDSSLADTKPGGNIQNNITLSENLNNIFRKSNIKWEIQDEYVLLYRENRHTLSGYVCDDNGESLVNVTVYDLSTQSGTLTNEQGFFSITLPEGVHKMRFSYIGFHNVIKEIDLDTDFHGIIYMKENTTLLDGVEVVADLNSPLRTTQTGKVSLTTEQLNTEFSLLSSPDLIKTIQRLPGVSSGTELLSGMYVHGGKNDENLFLLDGAPIYQVNHLGGLFSAFNTDIVKNVDFYKSGFPARYGGRLSSVVDVRTKEGNMKQYHGSFSLGLLDGRFQLEGPIVKDRTSFNFAIRRSWADVFTAPAFLIYNSSNPDNKRNVRYAFYDLNGKITHLFSDRNKLSLSVYSGNDLLKMKANQIFNDKMSGSDQENYTSDFRIRWGNTNVALTWNSLFSSKLYASLAGIYSRNNSLYDYVENNRFFMKGQEVSMKRTERYNNSTIDDFGYRLDFDYRPTVSHHLRFGSNFLYHIYRPQDTSSRDQNNEKNVKHSNSSHYEGSEISFYAEDDMKVFPDVNLNAGLHYTLYRTDGVTNHSIEPRLSLCYRLSEKMAIKTSYTEMSQFAHQLSSTYLNLPTDSWVPSTRKVHPMRSRQLAAGIYMELPFHLRLDVEGYYRTTNGLLEYDNGNSLILPSDNWENLVRSGNGKSYGMELSMSYNHSHNTIEVGYTLSWSKLKFKDFYPDWYFSKFDNKHKLNISFRHKFNNRIDAYSAWTFRSGDRATVPTQYVNGPSFPEVPDSGEPELVYGKPNNITLPPYHRLDVGVNFRRTTKKGFERIWNVSVYNAYCRMNPLYTKIERLPDGSFRGKGIGIFPIIPSFSYTLKF